MKRVPVFGVTLFFLLFLVMNLSVVSYVSTLGYINVEARAEAASETSTSSGAKHLRQVSGEVTAVDTEKKTITVGGLTILVDEEILAGIKEGDRVTVDYITRGMHRAINIMQQR